MFSTPPLSVRERAGVHHLQCHLVEQVCTDFPEPVEAEGQGSKVDMAAFINKQGGGTKSYMLWELI
jgi:hypothetical protein